MTKLKIGLLLDDGFFNMYMYDLADWARQQSNLEISHLITNSPHRSSSSRGFGALTGVKWLYQHVSKLFFSVVVSLESYLLRFSKLHRHHFDAHDLERMVGSHITIHSTPGSGSDAFQFSELDVRRVSALKLDLLIRFGSDQLQGQILQAARLGSISFGDGYDQLHSADLAGFWECYEKRPKTGFSIVKLTDRSDEIDVLLSGYFSTKFCFSMNQQNLYKKSSTHFRRLLQRIAITGELPAAERTFRNCVQPCRVPNFHESFVYLFRVTQRLGMKMAYRSTNYEKKWGLSFTHSNWRDVNLCLSNDAIAPRGHFWADPFVYADSGKTYCFVEDYVYRSSLGHIAVLEVANDEVAFLGDCIKEPFHLSFPFIFKYMGALYMCPEASASRQIRIYRSIDFPLQWELCSIIMEGISAADTMLFEHAGMWWMLTSIDESGSNDYTSELYLFWSESPLTTEWTAHPRNPIRIDSEGGRNAGLIIEDGKIFRLAQRQGFDQYGEGLLMFEITELTVVAYSEHLFSRNDPSVREGKIGTHHLSTTGAVTVFDHLSRVFSP